MISKFQQYQSIKAILIDEEPEYQAEQELFKECERDFDKILYWIYRALSFVPPYIGPCVRKIDMEQDQIDYFTPGKIFRFRSITSAKMKKQGTDIADDESEEEED